MGEGDMHQREWYHSRKKFIEIDTSIWREEIQNRNQLVNLAGRNSK
jgi:hypothetical protein